MPLPFRRVVALPLAIVLSACSAAGVAPRSASPSPPAALQAAPIPRRTGWVTVDDGTRIYREICGPAQAVAGAAGRGSAQSVVDDAAQGPAIVFVHGLGGNHAVWFQQVAHFARTHTVITLSQRGFAPSGGDGNRYDVDRLARDVIAVLDDAGVSRAVVVGQSMGGWTALGLALAAPDRVEALVLADTFGGIVDPAIEVHLAKMTDAAKKLGSAPPPLGMHPALSPEFSAAHAALAYLYQALSTFGSPRPDVIAGQLAAARVEAQRLSELKMPVLFVVGSGDRLFPPALIDEAAAMVPGAKVVRIDGAGHSPYFEKPAQWNRSVEEFVGAR